MKINLQKYLRARRPIIWCNTSDYKEIDDLLKTATKEINDKVIYEFRALGAVDFETKEISEEVKSLYNFLDMIYSEGYENNIFLLVKNAKDEMEKPEVLAYLKKIAELRYSNPNYNFTVLVVSDSNSVPKELEKFTSILEIENMSQEEIESYILNFGKIHGVKIDTEDIGEIAISLKGLSKLEIDHVLNMMIESKKNISISDRNIIIREKGQIIKKSAVLELIDFKERITDIGGLEGLKEWLESKAKVFRKLDEAKSYGVDTPKGVLLVGMPGCGKSLAAKASARLFNAPLLRLDIGRLLGKYVGESEHNMRVALKTAESISPCILWIDEIEKAFSGIDQSGGASDITKRLFGHFLTWLQEKENTVFVVATANDISTFPPEFLRKGRFDEVFFVDFPNEEERERIFEIHLEKRGKNTEDFDILKLAKATDGYCGADIEEVVKLTLETAFVNESEEIDTQDLLGSRGPIRKTRNNNAKDFPDH
uniref:AAA family ATPase n=1 Tax=uncultured Cetobacterium sp. TaxID=527638 RepID=UPI0025EF3416